MAGLMSLVSRFAGGATRRRGASPRPGAGHGMGAPGRPAGGAGGAGGGLLRKVFRRL